MTTGPRPTPHPIILHVDDNGNPVRLAEASAIYVTSAVIGTLSATNYVGLTVEGAGLPGGSDGQIQYRKSSTQFGGDSGLTYDESKARLGAVEIVVASLSATTDAVFNNLVTAEEILAVSVSAGSSRINNLSSTTISAVTVCATNYNAALEALSFQNLDNRYLNSSGDSVTGSFYLENLSSVTISATSYLNLPSALATWNASAIRGIPVTSTAPLQYQSLVYFGGVWQPSSVAGGPGGGTPGGTGFSIQFNNGVLSGVDSVKYNQTFNGIESTQLSSTNLSSVNLISTNLSSTSLSSIQISATTYLNLPSGEPVWNALKLQGYNIVKGSLVANDILAFTQTAGPGVGYFEKRTLTDYAGAIYPDLQPAIHANLPQTNASAIRGVTVTSTAPDTNNVLIYNGSVWTPSASISLGTIAAVNLGGTNIVGTNANINNVSSTGLSALALSATNISAITITPGTVNATNLTGSNLTAISSSATNLSAVNARITALSATTLSATTYLNLPSGTATWNASAIKGATVIAVDAGITTANPIGALIYNKTNNEYVTIPFSSTVVAGTRNYADTPAQGQIVASYLGSATPSLQINPFFNTTSVLGSIDLPQNRDVLVFSSDLYGYGFGGGWTWEQPSSLFTTSAAGSTGYVQFAGAGGAFSGDSNLIYYPETGRLDVSTIWANGSMYYPGNGTSSTYITKSAMNVQFLQVFGSLTSPSVSATVYRNTPIEIGAACSDEITNLATATSAVTFRIPRAINITQIRANVNTAPIHSNTSAIIIDINKNGTSIFTNRLIINSGSKTSVGSIAYVLNTTSLADDDEISVDIDQVGNTIPGKGLKIWIIGNRVIP